MRDRYIETPQSNPKVSSDICYIFAIFKILKLNNALKTFFRNVTVKE